VLFALITVAIMETLSDTVGDSFDIPVLIGVIKEKVVKTNGKN
jgi:hypothetical protein